MSTTTTPNMGLTVPGAGSEPGPAYANEINNDLGTIDAHDHSTGKGAKVTPSGISITADLPFGGNNANQLRAARFNSQNSALSGVGDVNEVYVLSGNLYFNNAFGTPVQVTNGSNVNVSGSANNVWAAANVSGDTVIQASSLVTAVFVNSTFAPVNVTLPSAGAVPEGRIYEILDAKGSAATNNITVSRAGGDLINGQTTLVLNNAYASALVISDGATRWIGVRNGQNVFKANDSVTFNSGSVLNVQSGTLVNLALGVGSSLTTTTSGTLHLGGGADDWVGFNQPRTHLVSQNLVPITSNPTYWGLGAFGATNIPGVQSLTNSSLQEIVCDIQRPHSGALLTQVAVNFFVGKSHSGVPAFMPQLFVTRYHNVDGTFDLVGTKTIGNPGTGANWYLGGAVQTAIISSSNFNVIDTGNYTYGLHLQDENGANAQTGNSYLSMVCTYTNINDDRFQ